MERIQRQSLFARSIHFIHTISCLLLFYTGISLIIPTFNILAEVFGGIQNSQLVHRISGLVFIGIPIILAIVCWNSFKQYYRELFSWNRKKDREGLRKFPAYFFNPEMELPAHDNRESGNKVISWFIVGSCCLIGLSGTVMYFGSYLSRGLVLWMYPLHELSMIVLGVFLLIHIYIGTGICKPYRGIWRAMFWDGKVNYSLAESHWPKWVKEEKAK